MRKLTWLLILGFIAPAWAGDTATTKFRLASDFLIIITGSIGPAQGLNFIVDTGAWRSAVDADIARRLGLAGRSDEVLMLGRSQPAIRVEIADLRFGPVSVPNLSVLAVDLTPFARRAGTRIDGVLGLDVLRGRNFAIDYRRKQLEFGAVELHGPVLSFDPTSPYLVVAAQVSGQPMRLLVDTGANRLSAFADRLPDSLRQRPAITATATSAAGSMKAAFLRNADIRVGNWRVPTALLFIIPGGADFRDYDGHLGVHALGAGRVYFDFDNGQLRWE